MLGAAGQDNKVCFVSKQAEGSPLPPAVALVHPGGCRGSVLRGGQPAARRTLSACRPRVSVSEPRAGRGTHDSGPAPPSRLKVCQPERAEPPFHSRCRPPPSAQKPTCLPQAPCWARPPWSGPQRPRPTQTQLSPNSLSPASGPWLTLFLTGRAPLPISQNLSSQLPQQGVRPASPWSSGVVETARVREASQTLLESAKERPPQATSESPGTGGIILPKGPFGALTPMTSGHDPAGKQGLHRENQGKSVGTLTQNACRPSKQETWMKRGAE